MTGTSVVYNSGGGTITGLTNGTTYFVITDGSDKIKLRSRARRH